jgi:hypothetical protein
MSNSYTGTPSESSNPSEIPVDVGVRDARGETCTNAQHKGLESCGIGFKLPIRVMMKARQAVEQPDKQSRRQTLL